jgi:hypothetical protein
MAKDETLKVTKTVALKKDDPKFGSLFDAGKDQVIVTYSNGNSQVLDKADAAK